MAQLVWKAAREKARQVREAYLRNTAAPEEFPVDLEALVQKMDIVVRYVPLESDLSGFIVKQEKTPARVYINALHPPVRQRFTLAHEIGHLYERLTLAGDRDFSFEDRRGTEYSLHEFYADEFAGELLMPTQQYLDAHSQFSGDYDKIADYFGVSISAAEMRGSRLTKTGDLNGSR